MRRRGGGWGRGRGRGRRRRWSRRCAAHVARRQSKGESRSRRRELPPASATTVSACSLFHSRPLFPQRPLRRFPPRRPRGQTSLHAPLRSFGSIVIRMARVRLDQSTWLVCARWPLTLPSASHPRRHRLPSAPRPRSSLLFLSPTDERRSFGLVAICRRPALVSVVHWQHDSSARP